MKKKIYIIGFILVGILLSVSLTYSVFNDESNLSSSNENFAKFIFNTDVLEEIDLSLVDLKPGDTKEYNFSVSNNKNGKTSNISIEYTITLNTYHFIPLTIKLYSITDKEELIMTCDETYERNSNNELVCSLPSKELSHLNERGVLREDDKVNLINYDKEQNSQKDMHRLITMNGLVIIGDRMKAIMKTSKTLIEMAHRICLRRYLTL